MVRSLRSAAQRRAFGAGEEVDYIVQSIDWEAGEGRGSIVHLQAGGRVVHQAALPGYPQAFDPRERPWYQEALGTTGIARTDPYVFSTTGALGLTFAKRGAGSRAVVGPDPNLASLPAVITSQHPTPSSPVVPVAQSGPVLAPDHPPPLHAPAPPPAP